MSNPYDAVVVGSGPNGLSAAVELARNGLSVCVLEAESEIGGGTRSAELTLPGFIHDMGSAIHPLGYASPFFRSLPLEEHGLRWIHPPAPLAHPFDDGTAAVLERSVESTAANLGPDAPAYRNLMAHVSADADRVASLLFGPRRLPRHPLSLGITGVRALRSAHALADDLFRGERARGLFAGNSAHSFLPLERRPSALFGIALGTLGHAYGWPLPEGGSRAIAAALASYLRSLGAEIHTGQRVSTLNDVPVARVTLFDVTPSQLLRIAGERFPSGYTRALGDYRYGPGVFKMDFALDGPAPWRARECLRAGTVHLGGTLEEISASEAAVWRGEHTERPFVLVAQQSLFDRSRAPEGRHTLWAYCHVPNGSTTDMSARIEAQIERFAPGFGARVLKRASMNTEDLRDWNANLVGGDINGGVMDLGQLLARPVPRPDPYTTPAAGIYLCSSSTPPGGGVHGMCGYLAARSALRRIREGDRK